MQIQAINAALSANDPEAYRRQRQAAMGRTPEERRYLARLRQRMAAATRRGDRASYRAARREYDAYMKKAA